MYENEKIENINKRQHILKWNKKKFVTKSNIEKIVNNCENESQKKIVITLMNIFEHSKKINL